MTEELQGATGGSYEPDRAPQWLQALLDNQNQQTKHLQMMLAPVLTHITGGNPAVQKTTPPLAVSSGDGDEILQRSTFDRHAPGPDAMPSVSWELPVRPREGVGGPFAAELDVINQRARNSGPTRRAGNIEPDSRRRD